MKPEGIAVIGGGNMGGAVVEGLIAKGTPPGSVLVVEVSLEKRRELGARLGVKTAPGIESGIGEREAVVIAVKPSVVKEVLKGLAPHMSRDLLLISVAAGVSIGYMEKQIGRTVPLVRCMPNIAAKVGKSAVAMCANGAVTEAQRNRARGILGSVGSVVEVEERHLDAVTGLSGSGPAFVFLMIEALSDGGVLVGLPREKALELALLTVEGAVSLLKELKLHPAAARELVTSPGGTTIEGLLELEEGGFRGVVMSAVRKAAEKSALLGAGLDG